MGELLDEARDFAVNAPGKHSVRLEHGASASIFVDAGRIAQVLRSFMTNAARYTRLVEAHGGKLCAESRPGMGATFAFSVQVAP
jgi:signal transduction histidine kinase